MKMSIKIITIILVCIMVLLTGLACIMIYQYDINVDNIKFEDPVTNLNNDQLEKNPSNKIENLEITDITAEEGFLTGKIVNTTNQKIEYIEVKALFYNKSQERIFEDFDCTSELQINEPWVFKMMIQEQYETVKFTISDNPLD